MGSFGDGDKYANEHTDGYTDSYSDEDQKTFRAGMVKLVRADLFPAYDEDGGLLACLAPHATAATFDD